MLLCAALLVAAGPAQAQVGFRSAAQASAAGAAVTPIGHVGAGTVANRDNCGAITPSIPAGSVNDVLVAVVNSREFDATVSMAGWNLAYQQRHTTRDFVAYIYWRRATSAAANGDPRTINQSGTCNSIAGQISRFSGVDLAQALETDPIPAGNAVIQDADNIDTGTQTTTVNGSMLLVASFIENDQNVTEGAGWSQSFDTALNISRDLGLALAYQLQASAGAASISDWPIGANRRNIGVIFALRPVVTAPANLVVNVPAGTTTGDVMIASIAAGPCSDTSGGVCTLTITPPAGWTQVGSTIDQTAGGGFGNRLAIYRRVVAGAEPANYIWSFAGAPPHSGAVGVISSYTGVDNTNPIVAEAGQATAAAFTHAAPSIDTGSVTDTMLVASHVVNSAATWTPPGGMTEAADVSSPPPVNDSGISLEVSYEQRLAAGVTGTRSATHSSPPTSDTGTTHMLALRPAVQLALVSATVVCGTTNQVEVLFSRAVTAATAENPANYALSGGATVSSATLNADARIVTLATSTLAAQSYTLTVNNIQAAPAGPIIAANSSTSFFAEGGYLSGLRGSYFANMTLAGSPAGQRVDGPVNFDWANGTPGVAGIGADNFSVRWEGFVTPSATGNFTFRTRSDDGVRLYVNGVLVINNWTDHAATNNDSAPIALTAGQRYPIVMEYYENGGQAVAQLSWSGPGTGGFQFIPRSSLSHFCGLPRPVAFYKMDELSWNGTAGEVADSSGNGLNMTAYGGAVPAPARVCNGAQLNAVSPAPLDRYLEIGHDARFNATTNLTVTAWIRPAEWPSSDLMTIASKDTNWEFHINPSGQIFWWWNTGAAALTTSGAAAAPLNTWTHVAIVFALGQQTIYVNGVSRATGTDGAALFNNALPLQIGGDQNFAGGARRFRGQIDEVRIYDATLTQTDIQAIINDTRPCVSTVDHYYVQHAASGINCQAEAVTITAHDAVHAPTSADSRVITISADRVAGAAGTRGDWALLTGTGSLANGTADDGVATYTFGAGETAVTLAYKNTWVQTVNVSVTDGVASDTSGNAGADAGYNQNLSFAPSGFRFVDGNNNIPAQTAGVSGGPFQLQAIQTGTGGCTTPGPCTGVCTVPTGFANGATVAVDLAFRCDNPTTCQAGQQVSIINNGTTAIAGNPASGVSSYTTKTLLFGADGRAAFNFVYPDVGAISLHVRYDIPLGTGGASGNLMTGSSNSFVVRPYGFVLSNIQTTAGAVANPGASDHTGAVFIRAGDDFSATVTSVNLAGTATPNFGREMAPETVRLSSALVAPAGGVNPALVNPAAFGSFSGGAATGTTFAWGEVGIITLTPEVGDADYLGAGNVTGTASGNVGRFIPFDFALTRNAPFFESGCSAAGKDAFTYSGEAFTYLTAPVLNVTARNRAGGTTQNYRDNFWKITNATLSGKTYSALSGSLDVSGIVGADPVIVSNGDGTGTLTFSAGTGLRFVRTTPAVPFNAEIALSINVIDSDATVTGSIDGSAALNPVRFGEATAGNGIAFSGTTVSPGKTTREMRFGRLRLNNAFGTTRLDLPLTMQAQYYDATGFRPNTDDNCTSIPASSIATDFAAGSNLLACETAIAPAGNLVLANGRATGLRLRAPGTGNDGRVDLRVNLNGASGNSCTALGAGPGVAAVNANLPHLQGNWAGGAYDQDPVARATFGIYRNANEFIYFQENF